MKEYEVHFIVPAESQEQVKDWSKRVWGPAGEICRKIHIEEPSITEKPPTL
jgi:hypothetical protein